MTDKICKISLFSFILACVSAAPAYAAVKANNSARSRADAYQQVNMLRAQQEYLNSTDVTSSLPVAVEDENLAKSIVNNEAGAPTVSELEACAMIYPNGSFKWDNPVHGIQHDPQCVAVVELRDANSGAVLATTTVAAGQSIKCNIDSFPSGSYNMSALSKIELPADNEPTMEDVIAVMNEEQKQNAGLKIAAGAIIAGVAGNLLAPKSANDKDSKIPLGTGTSQLTGTAIGAAAGAGIMAASAYSGKVAGDTIKSTAVNAASGMVVGNMLAGANGSGDILATTKCTVGDSNREFDCVVGKYEEYGRDFPEDGANGFYIVKVDGTGLKLCELKAGSTDTATCKDVEVKSVSHVTISHTPKSIPLEKIQQGEGPDDIDRWIRKTGNEFVKDMALTPNKDAHYVVESAKEVKNAKPAYAVFDGGVKLNKLMGYKVSEWNTFASTSKPKIFYRNGNSVGDLIIDQSQKDYDEKLANFKPSARDAEDGGLIDLSNQARAKGTIVGTAAGGALGGFAGYQGAKDEISQRWLTALREYEDSLSSFVCFTGSRYLSKYNDYADIPALKVEQ